MTRGAITLVATDTLEQARRWCESGAATSHHHAFPVVASDGALVGVLTRREITSVERPAGTPLVELLKGPPAVAFEDSSLREAADLMVTEGVGRLPVVSRTEPPRVVGMLAQSDLLNAHARRLQESQRRAQTLTLKHSAKAPE
jgi:CBS domain-containing protein